MIKHYPAPRPSEPLHVSDVGPGLRLAPYRAAYRASYRAADDLTRVDRIQTVRDGVPARLLSAIADDLHVPREQLFAWLGIARATAHRKIREDRLLNQDESERTLGIARLIGSVERIVAESGEPGGFDAAAWTAQWLQEPNAALGGQPPAELIDTVDGRALVASLIAQMQSGAYA